jgi:hypothetical protein
MALEKFDNMQNFPKHPNVSIRIVVFKLIVHKIKITEPQNMIRNKVLNNNNNFNLYFNVLTQQLQKPVSESVQEDEMYTE